MKRRWEPEGPAKVRGEVRGKGSEKEKKEMRKRKNKKGRANISKNGCGENLSEF